MELSLNNLLKNNLHHIAATVLFLHTLYSIIKKCKEQNWAHWENLA